MAKATKNFIKSVTSTDHKTTPITGLRTAKPADKRGPKAGSAMSNQSAREDTSAKKPAPAKINPDTITGLANQRSGPPTTIVETKKADGTLGKCVAIPQSQFIGELTKLAKVGGSLKAVEAYIKAHKPEAKLANGVTGRDAPHASKAVSDAVGGAAKPKAVAAAKPEKKAPAAKVEDGKKLTFVAPNPKKPGTATYDRYAQAYKVGKTITEVLRATTRADIDWDVKRGFITFG